MFIILNNINDSINVIIDTQKQKIDINNVIIVIHISSIDEIIISIQKNCNNITKRQDIIIIII